MRDSIGDDPVFEGQPDYKAAFVTGKDYDVPLLRLLNKMPGGQGATAEVCRLFEEEYRYLIPGDHYGRRSNGQFVWYNNACWSRARLKDLGLLDMPKTGIWRITKQGRLWLKENPNATRIPEKRRARNRAPRKKASPRTPSVSGITLEMLEQTRKLMPSDQFRQVWGALYDQLLAEERAKAITQAELGRRTRRWLDGVQAFLNGKNPSMPSSETICDWIHFCYNLELYREAAALLPYAREDEVDPALYKRAKRVAEVCWGKLRDI